MQRGLSFPHSGLSRFVPLYTSKVYRRAYRYDLGNDASNPRADTTRRPKIFNVMAVPRFFKRTVPPRPPSRQDTWQQVASAMDRADLFQAFYDNLFHDMDRNFVTDFIERTHVQTFDAHEIVVRQGEVGDCFYIVKNGAVDVLVEDEQNHRDVTVATLKKHQYFGEIALLDSKQPQRRATITTTKPTTLIQIMREDFFALLKRHPRFEFALRYRMEERQQQNARIIEGQ